MLAEHRLVQSARNRMQAAPSFINLPALIGTDRHKQAPIGTDRQNQQSLVGKSLPGHHCASVASVEANCDMQNIQVKKLDTVVTPTSSCGKQCRPQTR